MTKSNYGKLTTGLVATWFVLSLAASAAGIFRTDPGRPPLAFGLAILVPLAVFLSWFATSEPFRESTLALSPRVLTMVQTWRTVGFVFLVLYAYGVLPGVFALPTGWGDIVIGATAPLAAWKLANADHRRTFILWQVLGITDLVLAIIFGTTAGLLDPHGIPASAMTTLPLSLIPTFAVPLFLILHLICIAQARGWRSRQYPGVGRPVPSSAL